MVLDPGFREFCQLLNANNVRYLIIGGYAVAFHGYPRYTKDIDIWLWIDQENANRVVQTLKDFGFESLGLQVEDFLEAETVIQLGHPPNRIDLIMGAPGVNFNTCYESWIEIKIDYITIPLIDLENLKKNKRASVRLQDLADIQNLE